MTRRVDDVAMKIMNDCNVDDEVRAPGNVQTLDLQVPAFLAAASWNTLAAVGNITSGMCNVSKCR